MDELKLARDIVNARQEVWHWRQVPAWWWTKLRTIGWLVPDKEKALIIYDRALKEAEKTEKDKFVKVEDLAKMYAGQIYVFEEVLRNKEWQPIEQP